MPSATPAASITARSKSAYPLGETVVRLKQDIAGKGIRFFQEIDQHQLAAEAGIKTLPSTLLVFGNPPLGTQFLNAKPEAGIDWPVRILVQQDEKGEPGDLHRLPLDRPAARRQGGRPQALRDRLGRDRVDHLEREGEVAAMDRGPNAISNTTPSAGERGAASGNGSRLPGQVVLVLQGGGALGAYQVGVYQALHEAGIEPDWVIGTSIGAINAALIAGNAPEQRLERLRSFWAGVEQRAGAGLDGLIPGLGNAFANLSTLMQGIPTFFSPNPASWLGQHAPLGVESAAHYTTGPLRQTLDGLVDFTRINARGTRLTVGAVNVNSGEMRYFDSRDEPICVEHVMASGALPPAFPAVRVDGEPYWDGGIYSNTPIEAVLDDKPRRDSVIFAVQMWSPAETDPETLWQVAERQKEIQYASRARSHIARQKQIHHLRHIIRELAKKIPTRGAARTRSRNWRRGAAGRRCT